MSRRDPGSATLTIDPTRCTAHGLCAELLPERIELDDWGYPIIDENIPARLHHHAAMAVRTCPAVALALTREQPRVPRRPRPGAGSLPPGG